MNKVQWWDIRNDNTFALFRYYFGRIQSVFHMVITDKEWREFKSHEIIDEDVIR